MKDYEVEITETLQKTVRVKAESEDKAYLKAKKMYDDEEIVLSADDFIDKEINVIN